MRDAVIVAVARTPIGRAYKGAFNATGGATLGAHSLRAVEAGWLAGAAARWTSVNGASHAATRTVDFHVRPKFPLNYFNF